MRLGARLLASVLLLSIYLPVAVVQAVSDTLVISGLAGTETAGVPDTFTVDVEAAGVDDPGYTGTVQFSSTDSSATVPADYVFTPGDAGQHVFNVTFKTAGSQSVTATDSVDTSITDSANTTVNPGGAATVVVGGGTGNLPSGGTRTVTATVKDAFTNPVPNQAVVFSQPTGTGTVDNLTSPTTNGSGVATDMVTGDQAGSVVVEADAGTGSDTLSFTVVPGAVDHLILSPGSVSVAPGVPQTYTTNAYDANNNLIGDESSSASLSILPDGTCGATSCQATIHGAHTVTSTFSGKSDMATLTVGNNVPDAVDDAKTLLENATSTAINVLANDTDADNDPLTVTLVGNPPHGSTTIDSLGAGVHYTPDPNYSGADSFSYTISDGHGGVASATVNVTVTWVNQTPSFSKGANQSVSENVGPQTVTNWATAISPGLGSGDVGQALNFIVSNDNNSLFSSQPAISATGTLTYHPAHNATGSATVTIQIHDDGGTASGGHDTSATQTFTINVTGVNQAPSFTGGGDDTTLEDSGTQTLSGWATNISAGPPNESGQNLTFIVTNTNNALFSTQPAVDASSGDLTYTPAANANGTATVSVKLHDDGGTLNGGVDTSSIQTMLITVTAVNDAPTWTKGPDETVVENSSTKTVLNWASAFSPGPSDESGQTLSIGTTNNNNGLFSVQPVVTLAGTLGFTPAANANGSATVTVTLSDNGGTASGGVDHTAKTFVINVTAVNQAPSFSGGGNDTTLEDSGGQTVPAWASGMSPGPANESSQNLNFIVTNTNNALFSTQPAVDASSGDLTYTPAANANGVATVTVKLHDDGGTASGGQDTSAGQTMTITVTAVNDAPNFTDPADQTVLEDAGPQNVVGLAAPTSAGPTNESSQVLTFNLTNDNNALFASQPVLNPSTGTLTYTTALNANGSALVTATLSDDGGTVNGGVDQSIHTFTITVTPVNDAPTFTKGANVTLPEEGSPSGHSVSNWATGFNPGPSNESGQTNLGYTVTNDHSALFSSQPAISIGGTLSYTLSANTNGTANVSVTVRDSGGTSNGGVDTSAVQVFTITVTGVDHPPSTNTSFATIIQGSGPVRIDVLADDRDKDGDPLTIAGIRQGTNGKVAITSDHKFLTYDPNGSFIGTDSFIYSVSDGRGGLAFGTVLVTVVKDTIGPVTAQPTAWLMALPVGSTATLALTFTATDQGFGVKYYQVQESKNNTPWAWISLPVGQKFIHRTVSVGSLYQYRVRAVDLVGNPGAWVYLANFRPTLFQESGATYLSTWTNAALAGALGGRVSYAASHGSVASFTCTCSSLLWIGPKSSSRGTARVYIDGVLVAIYSEKSSTTLAAQGIFARTWGTIGTHRIDISVTGAGRIDVDGFLTLQ